MAMMQRYRDVFRIQRMSTFLRNVYDHRTSNRPMWLLNVRDYTLSKKSAANPGKVKIQKVNNLRNVENVELKSADLKLEKLESVSCQVVGNSYDKKIERASKSTSHMTNKQDKSPSHLFPKNHMVGETCDFQTEINNGSSRTKKGRTYRSLRETLTVEENDVCERNEVKTIDKEFVKDEKDSLDVQSGRERSTRPKLTPDQVLRSVMSSLFDDIIKDHTVTKDWSVVNQRFSKSSHLSSNWAPIFLNYVANRDFVPNFLYTAMSLATYVASLSDRHRVSRLVSCVAICVNQGGESEHELAYSFYEELRVLLEGGDLDSMSASSLIVSFAKTSRWHECLEFLEMIRAIGGSPTTSQYSPIVIAALRNEDYVLADKLFEEMCEHDIEPNKEVYMYMIEHSLVKKLLFTLQRFGWILSADDGEHVKSYFLRCSAAR